MPVTFKEADQYLLDIAEDLIQLHHPWLKEAKIGLMYRSEAIESGRTKKIGHARKVSEEMKLFMDFDFLIWIAEDVFTSFNPIQQHALVDHELCHCGGSDGEWKMRPHDFEEFHTILKWYGMWSDTLKVAKQVLDQPALPNIEASIERHSGMVSSVPADLLSKAASDPSAFANELVAEARKLAEEYGRPLSISELQRNFRIGYSKAARILELLQTAEERVRLDAGDLDNDVAEV